MRLLKAASVQPSEDQTAVAAAATFMAGIESGTCCAKFLTEQAKSSAKLFLSAQFGLFNILPRIIASPFGAQSLGRS